MKKLIALLLVLTISTFSGLTFVSAADVNDPPDPKIIVKTY